MPTVYLVEDETNIRELVVYTLNASGFDAHGFGDAPAFYRALRQQRPHLVLLDIMLPGESGLDILASLRRTEATRRLPVMMLTAKDSEYDVVTGLDTGADDYLAKPFGMMELVSRARALLRRAGGEAPADETLRLGSMALEPQKHALAVAGQPVALTLKEFELLQLLMGHPGVVFTRDRLLEAVWGYSYEGETRTVDVHVRSLRQKLGSAAPYVQTVRGVGYRVSEEAP